MFLLGVPILKIVYIYGSWCLSLKVLTSMIRGNKLKYNLMSTWSFVAFGVLYYAIEYFTRWVKQSFTELMLCRKNYILIIVYYQENHVFFLIYCDRHIRQSQCRSYETIYKYLNNYTIYLWTFIVCSKKSANISP